jgi:ABC-type multidrug transport system fused ATPase/permease subunit
MCGARAVSSVRPDASLIMTINPRIPLRVVMDGHDITMRLLPEYRERLGLVVQENVVLGGTVAENVVCAPPCVTRDEVHAP